MAVNWFTNPTQNEKYTTHITNQMDSKGYYYIYYLSYHWIKFLVVFVSLCRNYVTDSFFVEYYGCYFRLCFNGWCFPGFVSWIISALKS